MSQITVKLADFSANNNPNDSLVAVRNRVNPRSDPLR